MKYRKFKKQDVREVATIKNKVFKKFNGNDYFEKDAIARYYTNLKTTDEELLKKFKISEKTIFYIAEDNARICGYIKGNKEKIGNLFVLGAYHGKGIGRKLVELFEKEAKRQNSLLIKIASSIYAVPFYEKMGYKKTTGIRNFGGIKAQPMKKVLDYGK